MRPTRSLGRLAGGLYLLFGILYVAGASLTAHPGTASATFRAGVGIELLANLAFVATALALFLLFRSVDELAALTMVIIVVVASAVGYAEAVIQYSSHVVGLPGAAVASSLFSGVWLIPLGYLVLKSRYFPRIVGVLLLIAAASWLLQFFLYFFVPDLSLNTALFQAGAVGEVVFIAWLLIFSARPAASEASSVRRAT